MASILFAWQLGEGYGHTGTFLSIAAALRERGHTVIAAVPDPATSGRLGERLGDRILQAPPLRLYRALDPPPASYAQLLQAHGFDRAPLLREHVALWRALFTPTGCDMVIANHAPGALLAAYVAGIPLVQLGTGFAIPPGVQPSPRLITLTRVEDVDVRASERAVAEALRRSTRGVGVKPLRHLGELYARGNALLYSVPELDPFAALRDACVYIGPRPMQGVTSPAQWQPDDAVRVFGYLRRNTPGLAKLCERLRAGPYQALLHVPRLDPRTQRALEGNGLRFSPGPVDLRTLGGSCRLVLCNASHGVCLESLMARIPLLMFPTDQEKLMYAETIQRHGLGLTALPGVRPPDWDALLQRVLNDDAMAASVNGFACRHADLTEQAGTRQALDVIEGALPC
jgi:UDP:flavonoid glycosyltransferase YjiC (YdhE family)